MSIKRYHSLTGRQVDLRLDSVQVLTFVASVLVWSVLTLFGCQPVKGSSSGATGTSDSSSRDRTAENAGCTPMLLLIGPKEGLEARDATDGVLFTPALVGCARDLETLDDVSVERVSSLLIAVVEKDIGKAGARRRDRNYRSLLADLVNSELGWKVVTDVYLSDFFQWETREIH